MLKKDISSFLREKAAASASSAKILFPESGEKRIREAARECGNLKIAKPILLSEIKSGGLISEMSAFWGDLRKIPSDESRRIIENDLYLSAAMLYSGKVDGMVAGASHATAEVLKPVLEGRRLHPGIPPVTSSFFMQIPDYSPESSPDGILVFADCALNPAPSAPMLAHIAGQSAITAEKILGIKPRIAFLSYATKGSAETPSGEKIKKAISILQTKYPGFDADGELQADAALIDWIGKKKAPGSPVAGKANILVFPDLNSGNISYKLVERLGGAKAVGPVISGLKPPVNDLSRGCSADDIMDICAVTAMQAIS